MAPWGFEKKMVKMASA